MIQHVKPTVFYEVESGKFHDLLYSRSVCALITFGRAFFAHRLGITRTEEAHSQAVPEEFGALVTQEQIFLSDLLEVEVFQGEGRFGSAVLFPAIDFYEVHEGTDVGCFFSRDIAGRKYPCVHLDRKGLPGRL
jgi:hypothetical protein